MFVDGDFWHGNPDEWQRRGFDSMEAQFPASKRDHWTSKLRRNVDRDAEVNATLRERGWRVVRVWESDIRTNLGEVVARIEAAWN